MTKTAEPNRDKHLTYFKVENFKRFESFEMDNIGQFNLIVGDNNVGKTSVLEALLVDEDASLTSTFWNSILIEKGFSIGEWLNLFDIFCNQDNLGGSINFYISTIENKKSEKIIRIENDHLPPSKIYQRVDNTSFIQMNLTGTNPKFVKPMITAFSKNEVELFTVFSQVTDYTANYEDLKSYLKLFLPDLNEVRIDVPLGIKVFKVRLASEGKTKFMNDFGDGTIRAFEIIVKLLANKGKRLMIDELEAGIHYSRMKDFIKVILEQAHKLGVQLFMTTHSKECLKYFKEAIEELGEDYQTLSRVIALDETKDNSVMATPYDYEQFAFHVERDIEMRGHQIYSK